MGHRWQRRALLVFCGRMAMHSLYAVLAMGVVGATAALVLAQAATGPAKHGDHPAATYPAGVPAPIIMDKFTADPHAVVIGDTYYVYPTVDKENWQTTEFM